MSSRTTVVIAAVLAFGAGATACKGKGKDGGKNATKPGPPVALASSSQSVALEKEASVFIGIDAQGKRSIGVVPEDRDGGVWKVKATPDPEEFRGLYFVMREGQQLGMDAEELARRLVETRDVDLDLASLEDVTNVEEPPPEEPPPEEEALEDGDDGGVIGAGMAMALDEGKMGKRDSERAEGSYQMPRKRSAPLVPVLGTPVDDALYAGEGRGEVPAASLPVGERVASTGLVAREPASELVTVVLADVAADAAALLPLLAELRTPVGLVVRGPDGKVGRAATVLNVRPRDAWSDEGMLPELLVDLATGGVVVRSGPGPQLGTPAWTGEQVDAAALTSAYRAGRPADSTRHDVHVSVDSGVSVARLLTVIDALVAAGATEIVLRNWRRPELHGPILRSGKLEIAGDLAKGIVRQTVEPHAQAIRDCYASAVAADPALAGEVTARFFIAPSGKVEASKATGVSPAVSDCVAKVIKAIAFESPKGGGGAQVQYAFTFASAP